jgi:hypothetical protein
MPFDAGGRWNLGSQDVRQCAKSRKWREKGKEMMRAKLAAVAAVACLPFLVTPAAAHAEASSSSASGCPSGAVCIYNGPDANSGIDEVFYAYGPHNLSNEFGTRFWTNHQYGEPLPWAYLCSGYNGTGYTIEASEASDGGGGVLDFGPVNSVVLGRPGGFGRPGDGCTG